MEVPTSLSLLKRYSSGLSPAEKPVLIIMGQRYDPNYQVAEYINEVTVTYPGSGGLVVVYRKGSELVREILGVLVGSRATRLVLLSPDDRITTATFMQGCERVRTFRRSLDLRSYTPYIFDPSSRRN